MPFYFINILFFFLCKHKLIEHDLLIIFVSVALVYSLFDVRGAGSVLVQTLVMANAFIVNLVSIVMQLASQESCSKHHLFKASFGRSNDEIHKRIRVFFIFIT